MYLKFPQASDVITSFKAGWLQIFIQTTLDGSQATDASSDYSYPFLRHGATTDKEALRIFTIIQSIETKPLYHKGL